MNLVPDHTRARAVVALAASTPSAAQEWLKRDEFGGWETFALRLISMLDEPVIAARIAARSMTDDAVNEEMAQQLRLAALRAMLADARKRAATPRRGRRRARP